MTLHREAHNEIRFSGVKHSCYFRYVFRWFFNWSLRHRWRKEVRGRVPCMCSLRSFSLDVDDTSSQSPQEDEGSIRIVSGAFLDGFSI